jgi:hypothetical protein
LHDLGVQHQAVQQLPFSPAIQALASLSSTVGGASRSPLIVNWFVWHRAHRASLEF